MDGSSSRWAAWYSRVAAWRASIQESAREKWWVALLVALAFLAWLLVEDRFASWANARLDAMRVPETAAVRATLEWIITNPVGLALILAIGLILVLLVHAYVESRPRPAVAKSSRGQYDLPLDIVFERGNRTYVQDTRVPGRGTERLVRLGLLNRSDKTIRGVKVRLVGHQPQPTPFQSTLFRFKDGNQHDYDYGVDLHPSPIPTRFVEVVWKDTEGEQSDHFWLGFAKGLPNGLSADRSYTLTLQATGNDVPACERSFRLSVDATGSLAFQSVDDEAGSSAGPTLPPLTGSPAVEPAMATPRPFPTYSPGDLFELVFENTQPKGELYERRIANIEWRSGPGGGDKIARWSKRVYLVGVRPIGNAFGRNVRVIVTDIDPRPDWFRQVELRRWGGEDWAPRPQPNAIDVYPVADPNADPPLYVEVVANDELDPYDHEIEVRAVDTKRVTLDPRAHWLHRITLSVVTDNGGVVGRRKFRTFLDMDKTPLGGERDWRLRRLMFGPAAPDE